MLVKSQSVRSSLDLALPVAMVFGLPLFLVQTLEAAPARAQSTGQIFQGFDGPSGEDPSAFRRDERAFWGRNSSLAASSHFPGDGGPGADFDWIIRSGQTFTLDTSFSTITNADQTATQDVVNGFVNVRDLVIEPTGILEIRGPNACRIAVSGSLLVEGRILAKGRNHLGVLEFNTGGPSLGALGGPGGGRGGTGSIETTQSTPEGQAGYGAFDAPGVGGGGGETGFHPSSNADDRRGSGGGGGRFGRDVIVLPSGCAEQSRIGFDVEQGGPGSPAANGAIGGPGVRPIPGGPGVSPFTDGDPTNDFWGRMITSGGATIVGELSKPWAGSGGGAGGDAANTATFPTTPYSPVTDEIGGGGGGGGGSLLIQVLGDATFIGNGRIDVSGGTGGGGENTNGINRVGAAGGGGSGGHLILQVGGALDLQACANPGTTGGALLALGGQGGEGMNGFGGANPGGVPTTAVQDSINLVAPFDPNCVTSVPAGLLNTIGSGGDGGPGIIQVHVNDLGDVLPPTAAGVTLGAVVLPAPIGAVDANDPSTWNRMLPGFGPRSSARSEWNAVGTPGLFYGSFGATDATGRVITTGTGPNARVGQAYVIVDDPLGSSPSAPHVDVDGRTLIVDQVSFIQDVWWLHPATLVDASLEMGAPGSSQRFDIESASVTGGFVRLTVVGAGTPLAGFATGTPVTLRPRFFRVATNGVRDLLPGSASIRITFQGAPADAFGAPNASLAGPWTPNAFALSSVPGIAFIRYQVDFDLTADGSELTTGSPRPALEYIRIPYTP